MRAIFLDINLSFEDNDPEKIIEVTGDQAHHLNVVRVKKDEVVLVLNGKGLGAEASILGVQKNLVVLKVQKIRHSELRHNLSLAIACPKKDAFEDIVKMAVELGVKNIYPLSSKYSQYDYKASERLDRVIESALIQSNNFYWPEIHEQMNIIDFLKDHKDLIWFFNSKGSSIKLQNDDDLKSTILIGPEGGFSPEEVEEIRKYHTNIEVFLPTPILRAPTAFCAAIGFVIAKQK